MENSLPTPQIQIQKSKGGKDIVSARQLHHYLESRQDFSTWIKNRIEKYEFEEKQDYGVFHNFVEHATGRSKTTEYAITLDMAKELAMVEGNERGRQARRFFIEAEKQLRQVVAQTPAIPALPANYAEALRQLAEKVESEEELKRQLVAEVEKKHQARQEAERLLLIATTSEEQLHQAEQVIVQQAPTMELVQHLTTTNDTLDLQTAAQLLDIPKFGRGKLFEFLKSKKVLMKYDGMPYADYLKYFAVKVTSIEVNGRLQENKQVRVRAVEGMAYLRRILKTAGYVAR